MSDQGQVSVGADHGPGHRKTPWPAIVLAWTFVGVPWAWGVSQTVTKSLALFKGSDAGGATTAATQPASR